MRTARIAMLAAVVGGLGACSLLLNEDATQCTRDADCASLGFGDWVCDERQNVCVANPEPGAGGSAGSSAGTTSGGGGTAGSAGAASGGGGSTSGGTGAVAGAGTGGVASAGASGSAGAANGGTGGGTPEPTCEAKACEAAQGQCKADVCVISCSTSGCKPVCPTGMPCRVECSSGTCNSGVDCTKASACDVQCADNSCIKGVSCAGDSCRVGCNGQTACATTPIVCSAKSCDISCSGGQSCHQVQCSADVESCSIECSGVQACGTLITSAAQQTDVVCSGTDTCAGAGTLCCQDGTTCSGKSAPNCPP